MTEDLEVFAGGQQSNMATEMQHQVAESSVTKTALEKIHMGKRMLLRED